MIGIAPRDRPRGPQGQILVTEEELAYVRAELAKRSLSNIAREMGISHETLRRKLEPEWAKQKQANINAQRRRRTIEVPNPRCVFRHAPDRPSAQVRKDALYDPERDGEPIYASSSALLTGDPPVGRRELLERNASATARAHDRDPYAYWPKAW